MNTLLAPLINSWKTPALRKKILLTAGLFVIFRLFAHIPIPGVDTTKLAVLFSQNQFLALLDVFSGGTLVNFSILALGINPYINASIIFSYCKLCFRSLKNLQKKGSQEDNKLTSIHGFLQCPLPQSRLLVWSLC